MSSPTDLPPRLIPEDSGLPTLRAISPGAEQWLYRPITCLDHGFVYLVDYLGNDDAIVQAARVSYGVGTKRVTEDRGLIRYLRRHWHTTPSEMVELKFHCKMPIFVARQWIRHRTANVNEYSGRYSIMAREFYVPEPSVLAKQSANNRQGRQEALTTAQQDRVLALLREDYDRAYDHYEEFVREDGINLARELARIGLSVANYTEWYWKIDLHNLFHFLRLRADAHAQHEIRVYAEALCRIVKDALPISYEAFEDYQLHGMQFSRLEREFIKTHAFPMGEGQAREAILAAFANKRETEEFIAKLRDLNMIAD